MDENQKPAILRQQSASSQSVPNVQPSEVGGASAYMRQDLLDVHQRAMSTPTLWEKSYLCPCRNRKTRQPDPSCKLCHGRGIAFFPPQQTDVIVQSQEKGILNSDLGLLDSGTAIGSSERGYRISFRDRISLPYVQISQSLIFDATQKRIDNGIYMIFDVSAVDYAATIDGELTDSVDYTFDFDNNLFYPKQHLLNRNISINIQTTLRYMVADLLKEHRYAREQNEEYIRLPQKLLLKREDVFVDKERFESNDGDTGQMIDTKRPSSNQIDGLNGFFGGSN